MTSSESYHIALGKYTEAQLFEASMEHYTVERFRNRHSPIICANIKKAKGVMTVDGEIKIPCYPREIKLPSHPPSRYSGFRWQQRSHLCPFCRHEYRNRRINQMIVWIHEMPTQWAPNHDIDGPYKALMTLGPSYSSFRSRFPLLLYMGNIYGDSVLLGDESRWIKTVLQGEQQDFLNFVMMTDSKALIPTPIHPDHLMFFPEEEWVANLDCFHLPEWDDYLWRKDTTFLPGWELSLEKSTIMDRRFKRSGAARLFQRYDLANNMRGLGWLTLACDIEYLYYGK